jgi:hypothetical protein
MRQNTTPDKNGEGSGGDSPTISDVVAYDVDLSAFIYDKDIIPTLQYTENKDRMPHKTIKTPENVLNSVHADDKNEFNDMVCGVIENENVKQANCRIQSENSEWKLFELTARPAKHYPKIASPILTGKDISSQFYFEQRRQVINRVLRHDLRNEMNVIMGRAQMIEEIGDGEVAENAEEIYRKSAKMVDLGNEVRKIDQELNRVSRRIRRVDISAVIQQQIKSMHKEHPDVEFRTSIEDVDVVGNSLVSSALHHLIENCVEHNNAQNNLKVTSTCEYNPDEDIVIVKVIDNGKGIPKGEYEVITSGLETPLDHISGLGLWMVKWIAESVDGDFHITQRAETKGTVATLQFNHAKRLPEQKDNKENTTPSHEHIQQKINSIGGGSTSMQTNTRVDDSE